LRCDGHGVWSHHVREWGRCGIALLRENADGIAAGEDASQSLLLIHDQDGASAMFAHALAGALYRLVGTQCERVLILHKIRNISVGHDATLDATLGRRNAYYRSWRRFRALFLIKTSRRNAPARFFADALLTDALSIGAGALRPKFLDVGR
jgi:hypothetical protein